MRERAKLSVSGSSEEAQRKRGAGGLETNKQTNKQTKNPAGIKIKQSGQCLGFFFFHFLSNSAIPQEKKKRRVSKKGKNREGA